MNKQLISLARKAIRTNNVELAQRVAAIFNENDLRPVLDEIKKQRQSWHGWLDALDANVAGLKKKDPDAAKELNKIVNVFMDANNSMGRAAGMLEGWLDRNKYAD